MKEEKMNTIRELVFNIVDGFLNVFFSFYKLNQTIRKEEKTEEEKAE